MEKKDQNIVVITVLSVVIAILLVVVAGGFLYVRKVNAQLAAKQAALHHTGIGTMAYPAQASPAWSSSDPAAPDSVEGQLHAKGKQWVKTSGDITVGSYVQDILEGRMNQPERRGAIGKVTAVSTGDNGIAAATVDFGRGYVTGINLSELSLVTVEKR